jgi:hypothetical protein
MGQRDRGGGINWPTDFENSGSDGPSLDYRRGSDDARVTAVS